MEHPEVHDAPAKGTAHHSPIFVPVVKSTGKLERRGRKHRRNMLLVVAALGLLVLGAFAYTIVVERDREESVRKQTQ
jgi:hypothetical protein